MGLQLTSAEDYGSHSQDVEKVGDDDQPRLIDDVAEEELGHEIYKAQYIKSMGYPRALGGPIMEERVGDSSGLMPTSMKFQIEEDKVIESHDSCCYVAHWQDHFKSPTAERRHVLCVGVGGDRTTPAHSRRVGYACFNLSATAT